MTKDAQYSDFKFGNVKTVVNGSQNNYKTVEQTINGFDNETLKVVLDALQTSRSNSDNPKTISLLDRAIKIFKDLKITLAI